MFIGLKAKTHFGRPNFENILVEVAQMSKNDPNSKWEKKR